jgi:hypothetical protein
MIQSLSKLVDNGINMVDIATCPVRYSCEISVKRLNFIDCVAGSKLIQPNVFKIRSSGTGAANRFALMI